MDKTIKLAALTSMQSKGAEVKREPREVTMIGMVELIAHVKSIADKEDTQDYDGIIEQLKVIAEKKDDDAELIAAIKELTDAVKNKALVSYHHQIERNDRGQIATIISTPRDND